MPADPTSEVRYDTSRVWTYPRTEWDPPWWQKLGVPYLGGDEWGRPTLVIGFWFVGYLCWAYRTCWCQECHEAREETYRWAREEAEEGTNAS